MVAISKPFSLAATLALSIVLLGTAITCANAQKTVAPEHTPKEMASVVDCQAQCISLIPPFGNPPDIIPCLRELRKLNGDDSKVTKDKFEAYVLCNSKTLGKNEDIYFATTFDYKKNGFNQAEWTEFRNRTIPGFRRALHRCRGGCRKINFPKAK
ncbi:hypothetical protein BGZ65_009956 [Modicella reniformis]|uniref:Uncharacterized protein n=1 Tax=Modicella reniformis TaxID=1440133 RepID=A0A9P6IKH5_9FUNG|nr:hypothetical protein BGZ65_009956 [Modicella reniformis]